MKVRLDFVTNSSSSSFLIAYKTDNTFDPETLEKYPFLHKYSELLEQILLSEGGHSDTTKGIVYKDIDSIKKYFMENYGWPSKSTLAEILEDEEYLADLYENVIKYINSGYWIIDKKIDYEDGILVNIFRRMNGENLIILDSE